MLSTNHDVFGTLVRDSSTLVTFRHFPWLSPFRYPDPDHEISLLNKLQQGWVRSWERSIPSLAEVRRHSGIHSALLSLGIFEVVVSVDSDGHPSPAQIRTFEQFLQQEEQICRNVCSALLRYYQRIREKFSGWFASSECPQVESIEALAPYVSFDGIHIFREESEGLCPIVWAWNPDWDHEHKLEMLVYEDQVLEIGAASTASLLLLSPEEYLTAPDLVWGTNDLNDEERRALGRFVKGYGLHERFGE